MYVELGIASGIWQLSEHSYRPGTLCTIKVNFASMITFITVKHFLYEMYIVGNFGNIQMSKNKTKGPVICLY